MTVHSTDNTEMIIDYYIFQSRRWRLKPSDHQGSQPGVRTAPPCGVDVQQSGAAAVHPVPAAAYSGVENQQWWWERRKGLWGGGEVRLVTYWVRGGCMENESCPK